MRERKFNTQKKRRDWVKWGMGWVEINLQFIKNGDYN
jgi:hypothetical protein